MGWLYLSNHTKTDLIRELTAPEESEARRWETLAHSVRDNVLWAVVSITDKLKDTHKHYIVCHLLDREHGGTAWGYKSIDEGMHPHYYSCPLKYLKMVPEVACADWRKRVREYHQQRNQLRARSRKVKVGQKIGLVNASVPWVVITSKKPLRGDHEGKCYRIPARMLGEVIAV